MSVVLFILSLFGVFFSSLGLYEFVASTEGIDSKLPFCVAGGTFDCAAVAQSSFGTIFSVPLGSYGIVFYLWLAFFALLSGSTTLVDRRLAKGIFLLASFLSVLFSIYLAVVSKVVVGAWCPICLGIYGVNFLLFVTALLWRRGEPLITLTSETLGSCWQGLRRISHPGTTSQLLKVTLFFLAVCIALAKTAPEYMLNKKLIPASQILPLQEEWLNAPVANLSLNRNADMLEGDYSIGPESAKVEIVEYSDFECPACRNIYPVLEKLRHEFSSDVKITFKNFPLDNACNRAITQPFHQYACMAAEVARCAGEQGKYWQALDTIMRFPGFDEEGFPELERQLLKSLTTLGLDGDALSICRDSQRQLKKIQSDIEEGITLDLSGTPAIFVNGRQVTQISEDGLRELVKGIINGSIS